MVFSSFEFLFRFLPVFLVIYYITPKKWKNLILFAASIVFYTFGEAEYVILLLASVVVLTLLVAKVYEHIVLHTGNRLKISDMLKMANESKGTK